MGISVIIPVLNEAAQIERLVAYILQHGGDEIQEVIVADGGSTDQTVNLAQGAGATILHTSTGRAVQMNAAAAIARGTILYFVHADTLPPTTFAQNIKDALENGWEMGCFRYQFDISSRMLRFNAWFTQFDFLFCQGGDKTFFIPANLFHQLGRYDESYIIMEEYDFLKRAFKQGIPFVVLPENALVSARKYQNRSWLKVQIANVVVFNLWRFNLASPARLFSLYKRLLS